MKLVWLMGGLKQDGKSQEGRLIDYWSVDA